MNQKNNFITLIPIISLTLIILVCLPLSASSRTLSNTLLTSTSFSATTHQQTISRFIDEIKTIQNRTLQLMQLALENPIKDLSDFKRNINLVNNSATILRRDILEYQRTIPTDSIEYRDILLILNALNYSKNALYYLDLFSQTTLSFEKSKLLEIFYQSRLQSIDALNTIENLIL
ncbi:hypothetical protein [Cellulosilyticum sp. I15G10I2]|uniref:hypothetical protein n=1 Tax=Cellulosilyticum sp. I15G10I2 TaxID=1892843 RepID=UPI00114CAC52|nr:hypothetical protein [Cellulosilyticum sp. I15G10I2]